MRLPFLIITFCIAFFASAQQKRALIIGIDNYAPPQGAEISGKSGRINWPTLDGCKNDGVAIKAMIIDRYGFKADNINELYNEMGTRKSILDAMAKLLNESQRGDVAFFYYAGHGSQVYNSLSKEIDHWDESIVPVDTWKEGVEDIRDKTLAEIINKFIDKGVVLTCIYDCCHSGSIGRGFQTAPPKFRYIGQNNYDVKDASNPVPPETRKNSKYLILSAVQDNELAQEHRDENNVPHGAFTSALLQAMKRQSVNGSASDLFVSASAMLKGLNIYKEPVMGGDPQRRMGTLFGLEKGAISDKTLVAVVSTRDKVKLQGGFVIGLNIDNELTQVNGKAKLKVTSVTGPNESEADLISGDMSDIKPGDLFEVSNWVSSTAPTLEVYAPTSTVATQFIVDKYLSVVKELKKDGLLVNDFEKQVPEVTFYYQAGNWFYNDEKKGKTKLNNFSTTEMTKISPKGNISVILPPSQALFDSISNMYSSLKMIHLTDDPNAAQYLLFGTVDDDGNLAYGLLKTQLSSNDALGEMPVQTKVFKVKAAGDNMTEFLNSFKEYSLRLVKIKAWRTLTPPTNTSFPFHLEVRNGKNKNIDSSGIKIGENLELFLVRENGFASKWDNKIRYIYVFAIDKNGNISLLYPNENDGNVNNRFPKKDESDKPVAEVKLDAGYIMTASEPLGTDNYYLLATEFAIGDYASKFNQEGVMRDIPKSSPIDDLLNMANGTTRGNPNKVRTGNNWILQRIPVKTISR